MSFDLDPADDLSRKGLVAYHDGMAAEDSVELHFQSTGYRILARRWRGQSGEIDLIAQGDEGIVFVEVKKAKTHDFAAERLSMRQLRRICAAGEEYCARNHPGELVNLRVDLAMVDAQGHIEVLANISML